MKKNGIKILLLALVAAMALPLFACVGDPEPDAESSSSDKEISEESGESENNDSSIGEDTAQSENDSSVGDVTEEKTEVTTESTPAVDDTEETTEDSEEEKPVKLVYGYDFKDNTWTDHFQQAGSATRSIELDPAGSGNAVLAITHSDSQTASYIKNINDFENTASGIVTVGVNLYIPSDALNGADDAVQIQLNDAYNHHVNLVSDAKSGLSAFDTKDFPRDKWFTVRFVINMDTLRYELEIVEDGMVRTTVFAGRAASDMAETGAVRMRVHISGSGQTVYVDHMGVVTESEGDEGIEEIVVDKGITFLRIDGINAAGETLSLYGDFCGGLTVDELTDLAWERSDSYNGTYTKINSADGVTYTPTIGGYYLRLKAKYGPKTLTSYPVYIRDEANNSFYNGYLSYSSGTITAAVVYNNEFASRKADVKVVVYDGNNAVNTYTDSFTAKQGSDLVIFTFDSSASGKRIELTVTSGSDTLIKTEAATGMLTAKFRQTTAGSSVYIGNKIIADFAQNRYMRFRSSVSNDHWIGTEHNPIDMGFAYQETAVAGLSNTKVDFSVAPGAFKIVFEGAKPGLDTTQINELIGFWNAEKEEYSYIYNCSMTAKTTSWHSKSSWAASGRIEPFDYHLERMSILDRVYNKNQNGDLYDYVIYENGDELVRIPKLPVPRTAIDGKYYYGFFLSPGESVYYPDPTEGGWKSTILSDSGDTYVEICWSWYDIHSCSENSVPRIGSCKEFTVAQSWLFDTTTAEHDKALIEDATEVEWKHLPNYQLPLFSTDNTFETQFGGTDWQYAWWKSTYDCTMDAEVGHDGAGSVKIEKSYGGEASWYTEGVWGYPYSFDDVRGKTYRVSGYIKTENVVGEAYIANIQYQHATPGDNTVTKSESITGTTDWTYVTFTFTAQQRKKADGTTQNCIDHFFLTLNGTGTVWFDDVKIEEVK